MTAAFEGSVPRYAGVPGLRRKHYLFDAAGGTAGGVYLWETRAQAEAFHDAAWRAMISERYGAEPSVRLFDSPVAIENG